MKIRFRPISFLFRKDWYGNRLKKIKDYDSYAYRKYSILYDLGCITIVKYSKEVLNEKMENK